MIGPIAVALTVATTFATSPLAHADDQPAAVMPVTFDGEISDGWKHRIERDMVAGLDDAGVEVVAPERATKVTDGTGKCRTADCYATLSAAVESPLIVRAHVKLAGRDYEVYVESIDGADGSFAESIDDTCKLCGVTEVGEMLAANALKLHHEFYAARAPEDAGVVATGTTTPPDEPAPPPDEPKPKRQLEPRKWMAPTGWALLGVGVASVAAGATFLALHHRPYEAKCDGPDMDAFGNCRQRYDTRLHGAVLTGAGSALLVTGIVFVVVSAVANKRAREGKTEAAARLRALATGRF